MESGSSSLDEWPLVEFSGVMGTFTKMERQIEILLARIKNQDTQILELRERPIPHSQVPTPIAIVQDNSEVNEKMLILIQSLTKRCEQIEYTAGEYARTTKTLEKKVDDLMTNESSRTREVGQLRDRLASLESKLHDFQASHHTQMKVLDQRQTELFDRLHKLDGIELLPTEVENLNESLQIFKKEIEESLQGLSGDFAKQEERVKKLAESVELHAFKMDTVETDIVKLNRNSKSIRDDIIASKEMIDKDSLLLAQLVELKADKEDLFRKADKTQLEPKANKTEIERVDDTLSDIINRQTRTETSVYQGFDKVEKTTNKKLEDLTFSLIRVVKKEVKRVLAQTDGAGDVGQAAGSRNRCLMCDQVVKPMTRESPAQLPELPHTQAHLHQKLQTQAPTVQTPADTRPSRSAGKQRDKSPPHVFLEKGGGKDSEIVKTETEETVGIVMRSNEKTPVIIKDIPVVQRDSDRRPQLKKNLAGLVGPQEKTGVLNKGVVYDATSGNFVEQREYLVHSSTGVMGRQVSVGEIVNLHSSGNRLMDVLAK